MTGIIFSIKQTILVSNGNAQLERLASKLYEVTQKF